MFWGSLAWDFSDIMKLFFPKYEEVERMTAFLSAHTMNTHHSAESAELFGRSFRPFRETHVMKPWDITATYLVTFQKKSCNPSDAMLTGQALKTQSERQTFLSTLQMTGSDTALITYDWTVRQETEQVQGTFTVTRLLVQDVNSRLRHSGPERVFAEIRGHPTALYERDNGQGLFCSRLPAGSWSFLEKCALMSKVSLWCVSISDNKMFLGLRLSLVGKWLCFRAANGC